MQAVVFDRVGTPAEVLELRELPVPEPGAGEVLVQLRAASVNPGDFLFIQSLYPEPRTPRVPGQIAGNQGAGVVVRSGGGARRFAPGTLVSFFHAQAWSEYAVVPEQWLIPLPADFPIERAAQFANLITAWDLVEASGVEPGQWLALTAGNSSVAALALQLAAQRDVNTIAIVRSERAGWDLRALGARDVIELTRPGASISERIAEITLGKGLNAVLDSVGGPIAGDLVRCLNVGGCCVVYGGYSNERFSLHNYDLLLRVASIRSYGYRYFFAPPAAADAARIGAVTAAFAGENIALPIGGRHPLAEFAEAVEHAERRPELGKRLFAISE
jgi:NADPH2:quinone reductase